ncbi:hypothetical protein PHYBLDRAFT_71521 [Phycomyces blakesleeanus NRRL 1555(-)]|uniref:Uncharacterized protein n=1 Tax=Phycomyces blakesleeanus (strain ATCC 8743b / DSM 1359 / FGSC 10004 / NBRC 33097 / NRRL 1555) TaxID=763407 RepID=A0A162TPP3_PHYB8|nr:hypothetical protein PHYBLDRAFT_71521 [Phycomyces blakesleeanus NRRL 1555(-)]OAD70082.1 hypothetical protein PHYBLDRAFT_71521 [Phycomyces blakesleeanus NRRL 1555(-)]|eukprot:XP_018288122.1 hypothetical protein PHYBLDRAFT_71521 [Phycomyces blakesleeanus NRRL 1555(-)]
MSNNEVECSCSVCSPNGRYSVMVSFQTCHRHFADDVQRNFQRQSSIDMVNDNDNDMEIDVKTNISEDLKSVYNLPGSNDEDLSNSYEFNNKCENIKEQLFSHEMPADLTHSFIASFAAYFISKYIINSGSAIFIKFTNEVLAHFGQSFCLPLSLKRLNSLTGLSTLTADIHRFVPCDKCHKIFSESASKSSPQCCDFRKLSGNTCGNNLFLEAPNSLDRSRKVYMYNSITTALSIFFLRPGFERSINLWRFQQEEKYKKQNIVLVGLMPGPSKAKTHQINHYLCPLVAELNQLYSGVAIPTNECSSGTLVRAAILLVACDIPAARKTCGFISHASTNACHVCNCQYSCCSDGKGMDHSGFKFSDWIFNTDEKNKINAERWRQAGSNVKRARLEKENDVCWSELHRLQYFNAVECIIIDLMHNLFLGMAKRMMEK